MFQLVDQVPNVEPLLADLEAYILSEGLMVMKANSETITSVLKQIKLNHRNKSQKTYIQFNQGPGKVCGAAA
jgi:hypothetical protein